MKKSYLEKLKDPHWQKLRLEAMAAADWKCEDCQNKEKTLHVHHRFYKRGAEPWEYKLNELRVLCETCHREIEELLAVNRAYLSDMSAWELQLAAWELEEILEQRE